MSTTLNPWSSMAKDIVAPVRTRSRPAIEMKQVDLLSSSSSFRNYYCRTPCPCKLSSVGVRKPLLSLRRDQLRWLQWSHILHTTHPSKRAKIVFQTRATGRTYKEFTSRILGGCRILPALAVMLCTILGGTPAQAGPESTLQPEFRGQVDATATKISSVEAILAKQLARRFREMSDEELIQVLQELLKASRSSINTQDLVLDARSSKDIVVKEENKEDTRRLAVEEIRDRERALDLKVESEAIQQDSSASDIKLVPPAQIKGNPELPGTTKAQSSVKEPAPEPKLVPPSQIKEDPMLPGTIKVQSSVKGPAPEEALATKKSGVAESADQGSAPVEQAAATSNKLEETLEENKDMTGILWEEWRRRLDAQTMLEPKSSEEPNAADIWQNMQTAGTIFVRGSGYFFSWIVDNREAVGGGVLASGSIFLVFYLRQKFLAFPAGKGDKTEEKNLKVDRNSTRAETSSFVDDDLSEGSGSLLQAVPTSFRIAWDSFLGSEKKPTQVNDRTPDPMSGSSISNRTAVSRQVSPERELTMSARKREDDEVLTKPGAGAAEGPGGKGQNMSSSTDSSRRSADDPLDRPATNIEGRQVDGGVNVHQSPGFESRVREVRITQSSRLQKGKDGEEDEVVYKNSEYPSSASLPEESKRSFVATEQEGEKGKYLSGRNTPYFGARPSPMTESASEERDAVGKSLRGDFESATGLQRFGTEAARTSDLAISDRTGANGESRTSESGYVQKEFIDRENKVSSRLSRSTQSNPLTYRRSSLDREQDSAQLRDNPSAGPIVSMDRNEGFGISRGANHPYMEVASLETRKGDRLEREKGRHQVTQGKEATATPSSSGPKGPSETKDPAWNEGLGRRNDYSLEIELPGTPYTPELHSSRRGTGARVPSRTLTDNRLTPDNDPSQPSVWELKDLGYLGRSHSRIGGGAAERSPAGTSLSSNGTSSTDQDVQFGDDLFSSSIRETSSSSQNLLVAKNVLNPLTVDAPVESRNRSLGSSRQSLKVNDKEVQETKLDETRVSTEAGAQISRQHMLERSKNEMLKELADDNGDSGDTVTRGVLDDPGEDLWASSATSTLGAKGLQSSHEDLKGGKSDRFEVSAGGRRESNSKRAANSRPELDSFTHNKVLWVRDDDGVFLKDIGDGQEKERRRVKTSVQGTNRGRIADSPKRATGYRDRNSRVGSRSPFEEQRRHSPGFDYRKLHLVSNDDSRFSEKEEENRTSGSKRGALSPRAAENVKTRPMRYGTERGTL